jgi:hypothetical protein
MCSKAKASLLVVLGLLFVATVGLLAVVAVAITLSGFSNCLPNKYMSDLGKQLSNFDISVFFFWVLVKQLLVFGELTPKTTGRCANHFLTTHQHFGSQSPNSP